jgi:peptide/nickel transport system ATP-binding protein
LSEDIAAETMRHFRELADSGCGILMITHDIEAALLAADTIAVFYDGQTIDECPAADFRNGQETLQHPYTRALWAALPENGFHSTDVNNLMRGQP